MRHVIGLVVCFGCHAQPTQDEAEAGCAALQTSDEACFPDEIMADCVASWLDCDGDVAVLESCPIQFACGR